MKITSLATLIMVQDIKNQPSHSNNGQASIKHARIVAATVNALTATDYPLQLGRSISYALENVIHRNGDYVVLRAEDVQMPSQPATDSLWI